MAVAANELAKLPLRVHGRHPSIAKPIVMSGPHEVLVRVGDAISVIVHAFVAANVGGTRWVLLKALLPCSEQICEVAARCSSFEGYVARCSRP